MNKILVILTVAIVAVSMFVGCKNEPEVGAETSVNVDYFLESYNAADFIINGFTAGVMGQFEDTNPAATDSGPYMNYCYSATPSSDPKVSRSTDPLMRDYKASILNLFTNESKTKRVGIIKFTNYTEYNEDANDTTNGRVISGYQKLGADKINLEFKYKDQTIANDGKTWTDSSDEKTGYFICNAIRTKEAVEGSTTKFKYTVTDLKLSIKPIDGDFLDVSSEDTVSYKSISYVIDGTDLSTLEKLTCDDTALTAEEIAAVIKALSK